MAKRIRLTLGDILEGKVAARPQAAGVMEVVPLLPQDESHHNRIFAVPNRSMFLSGNPAYGTVIVENKDSDRPLIVPSNAAWLTKHRAQDHALCKAGLLNAKDVGVYENAACVQASQGGQIPPDLYRFQILPATLRRMDQELASQRNYSKLWTNIRSLNRSLGLKDGGGHLEILFKKFEKELSQFVAEFENIPGQIGALVIINDRLVGVEIAPSPEYWESVWEPLIRFCYGPEALLTAMRLGEEGVKNAALARPRLKTAGVKSLDDLEQSLVALRAEEKSRTEHAVRQSLDVSLEFKLDQKVRTADPTGMPVLYRLASTYADFIGQVVIDEDYVVYASLVNRETVPRRPLRRAFRFLGGE